MPVIAGADECGYGALAGPMFFGGAVAHLDRMAHFVCRDSKKYSANVVRMMWDVKKDRKAGVLAESVYRISAHDICRFGYIKSRMIGFHVVAQNLRDKVAPYFPKIILDGSEDFGVHHSQAIVKADDKIKVVSFASVIGKIEQKRWMAKADRAFPEYQFIDHAGYGTQKHIDAIREHGVIPGLHRIPVIAGMFRNKGWTLHTRTEKYEG